MIKDLKDKGVSIHEDTFIAGSADILGDVKIDEGSSIWFGAVIRGDINYIRIGKSSNIQDNATLHIDAKNPIHIGDYTTIGHNAVVHGCIIGDNCLIGMGSIVLNGATIGDNCIIGAGAVVTENSVIPLNSLVIGIPGKIIRQISEEEIEKIKDNAIGYEKLWREEYR